MRRALAEVEEEMEFELPAALEAHEPPEERGDGRDDVRVMVSYRESGRLVHAGFDDLPRFLRAGDLLALNTSGTLAAALDARDADGTSLALHLSTPDPAAPGSERWIVELRRPAETATAPFTGGRPDEVLSLPGGGRATLLARQARGSRLWLARLELPEEVQAYLSRHGRPIRYRYVDRDWPLDYYQTAYATEAGSAEMPSAGRALTPRLITRLAARGIQLAPLILHTGVSSLEEDEPPYAERYRVPAETARMVNAVRAWGGRVIAVGTTAVRALETVARPDGTVVPGEGWTELVVTPERGTRAVDGVLTGWHEPHTSHLQLLEALAGPELVERSYHAALESGYLWHEFGDLQLILPE